MQNIINVHGGLFPKLLKMCRVKICLINKKVDIIVNFEANITTFMDFPIDVMHQSGPFLNFANLIIVQAKLFPQKY